MAILMLLWLAIGTCNGPLVRTFVAPEYPWMAHLARIQGETVVRVVVDEQGRVSSAKAITGSPLLQKEAAANAAQWTFEPGMKTEFDITYEFRISGAPVISRPIPSISADFCSGRVIVRVSPIEPNIDVQKAKSRKTHH